MTKNEERFNKSMKRLLKAEWADKERAAVLRSRKPFAACVDYKALEAKYQSAIDKAAEAEKEVAEKDLERRTRRRRTRRRSW